MMAVTLTANDLLAGASQTFSIELPAEVLPEGDASAGGSVRLKPLTVADVQRIGKAAKDQGALANMLMVQQALVEPALSVDQVGKLSAGLAQFLLGEVNRISGLKISEDELESAVKAPLTRATFTLAKEFGWTPAQCAELTVGQVLLYLDMLAGNSNVSANELRNAGGSAA